MKQEWVRITEDINDFSKGTIFRVDGQENGGLIVSEPDNPFNIEWVEDGVYEFLEGEPF